MVVVGGGGGGGGGGGQLFHLNGIHKINPKQHHLGYPGKNYEHYSSHMQLTVHVLVDVKDG